MEAEAVIQSSLLQASHSVSANLKLIETTSEVWGSFIWVLALQLSGEYNAHSDINAHLRCPLFFEYLPFKPCCLNTHFCSPKG